MIGLGYHLANWRHPDAPADGNMSLPHFVRVIQAAERGLFDMGFLAEVSASASMTNRRARSAVRQRTCSSNR